MTRTHPNQSPDTLISLLNLSSKSALLIPTLSTNAFHSTNLFLFSGHHIPTNSVTPFSDYKPTQPTTPPLWRRANARNVSLCIVGVAVNFDAREWWENIATQMAPNWSNYFTFVHIKLWVGILLTMARFFNPFMGIVIVDSFEALLL